MVQTPHQGVSGLKTERSLVMVKPDGVHRGLVGEVIGRIESKGFTIRALKMLRMDEKMAKAHYSEHEGKPFFSDLAGFITSGPVVAMVIEGDGCIEAIRMIMGRTDPKESPPGTIRGDLAVHMSRNVVHGSDSGKSAEREISLFFGPDEMVDYDRTTDDWVYPERSDI